MNTALVVKQFKFQAAHQLPNHDGHCKNLHGHSYLVEIGLRGDVQKKGPKEGMVVDFGDLKAYWTKELEPSLDHQFLNQSLGHIYAPTAENLAAHILAMLAAFAHGHGASVEFVRVWETDSAYAQVP